MIPIRVLVLVSNYTPQNVLRTRTRCVLVLVKHPVTFIFLRIQQSCTRAYRYYFMPFAASLSATTSTAAKQDSTMSSQASSAPEPSSAATAAPQSTRGEWLNYCSNIQFTLNCVLIYTLVFNCSQCNVY